MSTFCIQEIGLGNVGIQQMSIYWPASGIRQTVADLKMNGFYKIREGDPVAKRWIAPTFKLPGRPDVARR